MNEKAKLYTLEEWRALGEEQERRLKQMKIIPHEEDKRNEEQKLKDLTEKTAQIKEQYIKRLEAFFNSVNNIIYLRKIEGRKTVKIEEFTEVFATFRKDRFKQEIPQFVKDFVEEKQIEEEEETAT